MVACGLCPSSGMLTCALYHTQDGQGADVLRACPVCRVMSHFVIPSSAFVDDPEAKAGLIDEYQVRRGLPVHQGACGARGT